jgi:hypothetical protein
MKTENDDDENDDDENDDDNNDVNCVVASFVRYGTPHPRWPKPTPNYALTSPHCPNQ